MRRPQPRLERWPLLFANAPVAPSTRGRRVAVVVLGLACAVGSALPLPLPLALRIVLGLASLLCVVWAAFARRPPIRSSGAYVEADSDGLVRVTQAGRQRLAQWDTPFGVTLLASYGRATALLAFTTPAQTRYVPVRIDDRSEADDELLARIAVLADLDLLDGVTHEAALTGPATAALIRRVEAREARALGRAYLSDATGTPIALDRATLALGERTFDLTSQLEWRPLMFHESAGQAGGLYQATWIKQAAFEVVLVAPMPASLLPRDSGAQPEATGRLGRTLTRDLRLLQAPAESPPPREARVPIDRPFMMAVRRALDDAPLAARAAADAPPRPKAERRRTLP